MYRLIRFLAVIALALSPVWGVQTVDAMNHAAYPVWPSFLSTGCNGIQGPGGSTTIACGQGAFLLSQVNSGYACTTVSISVTQYQSGPFTVVGTANSGSVTNTVSIDATGDYYMQFQGYLTNNLIVVQISAPGSGAMTIGTIGTGPCPVAPTATPVPPTNTPNPSDTATPVPDTATPGPSHTPTAIPTFTPLPSGHSTFTPTATPTAGATSTVTATPGPTEYNCGDSSYPLVNCNWIGGNYGTPPDHWSSFYPGAGDIRCSPTGQNYGPPVALYPNVHANTNEGHVYGVCGQSVDVPVAGTVYIRYQAVQVQGYATWYFQDTATGSQNGLDMSSCQPGSGNYCVLNLGGVSSGPNQFGVNTSAPAVSNLAYIVMDRVWVQNPLSPVATPVPADTGTPVPGTSTDTAVPSATNIPIPGAQSTPIATSTECPGGCAVAALTAIPGLSTRVLVDTSPFSELTHLSLARNSCKAFGYVQIPEPVIHGTPALGSTTPLSITWTLPVTHDWDNTNPYSNTAIQPCAMNEIPTFVWDLTYWFSVFAIFTVWIMWLLGFVGRFSGDENING